MNALPSGLPESVDDSEALARFCTSSSWFARQSLRVKYPAFLPAPDDDTSVYRITGLSTDETWHHAENHFVNSQGEPHRHHGAAVVETSHVRAAGIDAIAHERPPRHANLRGWPLHEDPVLQKSKRKAVATRIADNATFLAKS